MSQDKKIQIGEILHTYDIDIFTIMEANLTDDKLKYYHFPGFTLYLPPKDRQVESEILTGEKEGLTSHYDPDWSNKDGLTSHYDLSGVKEGLTSHYDLIGEKEGLTSHYDPIKSMGSTQDICEIIRLIVWKCQSHFTVYAIYNPPQNSPKFDLLNISHLNSPKFDLLNISHKTVVLGHFNAHSTRRGYKNTSITGNEIKDLLNSNPLELIYSNADHATYLHYNGTRTTPDLLLASRDINEQTHLKIIDDPCSGHKPVISSIAIGSKSMTTKENELHTSPLKFNQHPDKLCDEITNIMIRCAKKTIFRGKTKTLLSVLV
ncbi:unnamed protein product [Rodentolepis nana]|uniref:Endo/exonuclease/phosphatase domain-containing protein n=1 Tax=Rodentolepis nana TaxID=102285 RepID=A0A0R3TS88_RODNA|nr:unnamed protein product [Rodentolepis nana]